MTTGSMSSGQKGTAKGANKSTEAKLHNAVLKTLCVLSQQVREVRERSLHVLDDTSKRRQSTRKRKEQLRACSELAATKGKGHGLGPPGIAAFTGLCCKRCRKQAAQWERPTRLEWQTSSKRGTIMEPEGAFEFGTSLQAGQSVATQL